MFRRSLLERERGQETWGTSCLLVPDYWTSWRKRRQEGKERGEEEGKEGKVMPLDCKERCGRTLLERERGKRQADAMPSRAFLLDFLEKKKKTRGKGRG